jgi:hypothetical protein
MTPTAIEVASTQEQNLLNETISEINEMIAESIKSESRTDIDISTTLKLVRKDIIELVFNHFIDKGYTITSRGGPRPKYSISWAKMLENPTLRAPGVLLEVQKAYCIAVTMEINNLLNKIVEEGDKGKIRLPLIQDEKVAEYLREIGFKVEVKTITGPPSGSSRPTLNHITVVSWKPDKPLDFHLLNS